MEASAAGPIDPSTLAITASATARPYSVYSESQPVEFIPVTLGMVAFIIGVLVLLARAYPGSGADLLDWKPTRDYETEFQLEEDDISQMIAAQNKYRRKRGERELTELDAERMGREDQRVRERGRMDEDSLRKLDRELRNRQSGE